jgi:phosphoribosylanthranilate isomerase
MIVKICGITRREDAIAAAEAGAAAIGFVFAPQSPRCVSPETAAALGEGLPVWKVGVFVDETAARMEAMARAAKLDVAQIYGGEDPRGIRIWRAYRPPFAADPWTLGAGAEAILLDGAKNGVPFDWSIAAEFSRGTGIKVIAAGGLDASNVAEAIRIARPWGVDASSKLEIAPGVKDHEKVRAFVTAALQAAAGLTASTAPGAGALSLKTL